MRCCCAVMALQDDIPPRFPDNDFLTTILPILFTSDWALMTPIALRTNQHRACCAPCAGCSQARRHATKLHLFRPGRVWPHQRAGEPGFVHWRLARARQRRLAGARASGLIPAMRARPQAGQDWIGATAARAPQSTCRLALSDKAVVDRHESLPLAWLGALC